MKKRYSLPIAFISLIALFFLPIVPNSYAQTKNIPPQYDWASSFSEGLASVEINGKDGFIDKKGKMVIKPQYGQAMGFSEGLSGVEIKGTYLWGFIDKKGKMVIKPQYHNVSSFSEGMAQVFLNGKQGYINKSGKQVVKPQFRWSSDFSEGLAAVDINGKKGFIDKTGKVKIKPQYDIVEDFSEGRAVVAKLDKIGLGRYGVIDKNGKIIIPLKYDDITSFSEGLASVMLNRQTGFIDTNGTYVIKPQDWRVATHGDRGFHNGLSKMLTGQMFNEDLQFIDKSGKTVFKVPNNYDDVESFSEGLAEVYIKGKFGFIDKTGAIKIKPQYTYVSSFTEGMAVVGTSSKNGDRYGYIVNPLKKSN
ncbi:WG repeat-containing protein [Metabacillus fastidiosus]|uniref:WG repeat-containing protein n=1 Tax=Metabacillus fastidiosus TaxID=1458 RepID=UPI0008253711|nr:WG repeat-containing protein [Metabacillus fastidiosus]